MANLNGVALAAQTSESLHPPHHGLACLSNAWSEMSNGKSMARFAQMDLARTLVKSIEAEFSK